MLFTTKESCFPWTNLNVPKKFKRYYYKMGYDQYFWRFVYVSHLFCFIYSFFICVNHYITKTFLHLSQVGTKCPLCMIMEYKVFDKFMTSL